MSDVYLYVYDLSMGLAKTLSQTVVGRQFDGIWHTSVVVYDFEYFFCESGICSCQPGSLSCGQINERKLMGRTKLTREGLRIYFDGLRDTLFKPGSYNLLKHNCNTFTAHAIKHLTGEDIPAHITSLPSDFLDTPIGALLRGMLEFSPDTHSTGVTFLSDTVGTTPRRPHHGSIKPVLFDEPLSADYSREELTNQFSGCNGLASQWASAALKYLLEILSPSFTSENVTLEALSLLKFNRWATFRQCESICEVFRLAVWRSPELIVSFLSDPNKSLHQFAEAFPTPKGQTSSSLYYDLDATKARLLCNIFSLTLDWDFTPFIPLNPIAALCNRLIANEETPKALVRSPEHEMMGLALTINLALCPQLQEPEALEVAASLFHLLEIKKSFKYPTHAFYVLQAVYVFLKNFPSLIDLAKALNIRNKIPEVASQAEYTESEPTTNQSHVDTVHSLSNKVMKLLSD